ARQHEIALAALLGIEAEFRFARTLRRDADLAILRDVGDAGILQRLLHRLADLRARAADKALAIGQALALRIEAPVDEVGHGTIIRRLARLVDAHVPFNEAPHLPLRVTARQH